VLRTKFLKFTVLLILPIVSCTHHPPLERVILPIDRLRKEIHSIFEDPSFSNAFWGVVIQSLDTGEMIYKRNENKGFMPASNMKLFTTTSALILLTPEFRYHTNLYYQGDVDSMGILHGDIIIRGSGDPSISARYQSASDKEKKQLKIFRDWAEKLKQAGIKIIDGNVIGDDNYFEDEILGKGWAWDDQSDSYSPQISALSFNDNCMNIAFTASDTIGGIAEYELLPDTRYVTINFNVKTVEEGRDTEIHIDRKRGTNDVEITGSISINREDVMDLFTVENPTLFTATIFKELLLASDIEVKGDALDIDDLGDYSYSKSDSNCLATYISPPLKDIIKTVNKVSQNLYAELLLRTLGARKKGMGDLAHSVQVVHHFLSRIGINPEHLIIADGSGVSRRNLITPMQVITLLRYLYRHPYFPEFYDSLPIAGVDGTIGKQMIGTLAQNNVRAKTGTLGHVRALSGYVKTKDGENIVFSMITNNYIVPTSMAKRIQDLVCERIANFSRK